MHHRFIIFIISFMALTAAQANLLTNGDFETTVSGTSSGNNVGTVPPGWTVLEGASYSNLQINSASGVGGYTLLPHGGSQFLDGTGPGSFPNPTVHFYQTFTVTVGGYLEVSAAWGGRDTGADTTPSHYSIYTTGGTLIYDGTDVTVTPASWVVQNETSSIYFGPGNYVFGVFLSDPINVDDLSVIVVPEPSTYASGILLLGFIGFQIFQRRRRKNAGSRASSSPTGF